MYSRVFRPAGVVAVLLALVVLVPGCGGGLFGQETAEEKAQKEWSEKIEKGAAEKATSGGEVMEYAEEDQILIWKAGNDGGIEGGGGTSPEVVHDRVYYVTEVTTYHAGWGPDAPPAGTISMRHEDGTVYGPWQAEVVNGAYWTAHPDLEMPAGTYTLIDSDPSTWAQNSASGGTGMGWAYGVVPE